jgi:hypothetical protein
MSNNVIHSFSACEAERLQQVINGLKYSPVSFASCFVPTSNDRGRWLYTIQVVTSRSAPTSENVCG